MPYALMQCQDLQGLDTSVLEAQDKLSMEYVLRDLTLNKVLLGSINTYFDLYVRYVTNVMLDVVRG
jgi:hypothetical protein